MRIIKPSLLLIVPIVAGTLLSQKYALVGQDVVQFGTIQGTVMREDTAAPLAGVQITVVAKGSLAATGLTAQQIFLAVGRGAALNHELVRLAEDSRRGGPRAAIANAAPLTAVSDSLGRFTVRDVPAGENFVRAELQNYFGPARNGTRAAIASETVAVIAQQTAAVKLSLIQGGIIRGRVLDSTGKPVQNSPVQALQAAYDNGAPSLRIAKLKRSDDRGEFRIDQLAPGEYYLAASPVKSWATGAVAPATTPEGEVAITTLYPNTTDSTKAVSIVLHEGEDIPGMNIQLRTVPGAKISGRVMHTLPAEPPAAPGGNIRPMIAIIGLTPRDEPAPLPAVIAAGPGISASADGTFEISNVPPGSYDLSARLPAANGWAGLAPPERAATPFAFGRTSVEVRSGNVDGVTVLVHQGMDVRGRITVDGQPPAPNSFRIALSPDNSSTRVSEGQMFSVLGQIAEYAARIGGDGSFTFPMIPDGRYRPQIEFLTADNSYLADIRQAAASIFDNGLTVGREALDSLEVIVNSNGGSIEGTIRTADGKPVPRTAIVLVPPPNRRQNAALFKSVQTDAQGHFVIAGVPPGPWKLFAWESVRPGAYQNREFMQKYEACGTNVTVTAGVRASADAALIRNQ
jgi:Carboxypeptidase regulatory-like domain